MIATAPCDPWPVDFSCCDLPEDTSAETIDRWTKVASIMLWRLSGMRWGPSCPLEVRPCRRSCLDAAPVYFQGARGGAASTGGWIPYKGVDGQWRNASVCGCQSDCSCGELCEVYLPGPVYDIVQVDVDGEILTRPDLKSGVIGDYRVDAPGKLVRTDGECWPDCQDMASPPGVEGTFTVTYRTGLQLDEAAIAAVSELTCHYIKGCGGGSGCGCKVNRNVSRVSRQGFDVEMADPTVIYTEGRTGLPLADAWLATVNPGRLASASRAYSVDFRRPRVTTWP
ncbi:hypothetical protein EES44_24275 [Streptomyces sp. ADI96-15]|uniref:hypothetical protein n=1 Tax=Streptomyces sp. ADI96-15 TaxID=1522761 RepID=UPI000F55251B|nr:MULTISPECIES: hypothetical protein [unclassified Streptomyces]MDH6189122.1 hypothetical protein [Streptomyces sp. CZ24]RPK58365.1 hypothetical protein EES44_24275 [Streptomyces sp. ADI96-15]